MSCWPTSGNSTTRASNEALPHPVIRKVTFTGSTPVGKQLAALAGAHTKRVTMDLGGDAPVIIAEDTDVALAVKAAGGAKFGNAGQVCISPTRFLAGRELLGHAHVLAEQVSTELLRSSSQDDLKALSHALALIAGMTTSSS